MSQILAYGLLENHFTPLFQK